MLSKQGLNVVPHKILRLLLGFVSVHQLPVKLIRKFQNFVRALLCLVHRLYSLLLCFSYLNLFLSGLLLLDLGQRVDDLLFEGAKKILDFVAVSLAVDLVRNCLKVAKLRLLLQNLSHVSR